MVKRYAHFAPEHLRAAPANLLRFRYGRQRHHCRKRRNMLIIWLPDQARTWDLRIDSPSRHCSESRASQSSYGTRRAALWVIATLLLLDRSGRRLTPIPHPMATRICRGYDLKDSTSNSTTALHCETGPPPARARRVTRLLRRLPLAQALFVSNQCAQARIGVE